MRNSILKTVYITLLLALCASCNSDDTAANDENATTDDTFLTAKVDGVDFEVRGLSYAITVDTADEDASATLISVLYEDESRGMAISISNLTTAGTYVLYDESIHDLFTDTYAGFTYGEQPGNFVWATVGGGLSENISGTVSITELNADYLSGTFSFTGINLNHILGNIDNSETYKTISEGRFRVKRL